MIKTGCCGHVVHEDLAQTRGDGPHRGLQTLGQLTFHRVEAFAHQLAGEIDVRAILEYGGHLGQAVAGEGAGVGESRHTGERVLHQKGDALLGLQWRVAGRLGVDHHLHVGDVGNRVDGQAAIVVDSQACQPHGEGQHQPALLEGETDEFFQHRFRAPQ